MKVLQHSLVWLLVLQLSGIPAILAQPVLIQPGNSFGNRTIGNGVDNLRVSQQSPDGTDTQLTMDYTYDGFGGTTAQILPVIGKRGQNGVSAWFGSDPVTVGRGRGTITLRVRYFNDEPGVPAVFTSDQIRILLLNPTGTAIITAVPFLKTINWGNPNARPEQKPATPTLARLDKAGAEKLANEKREAEAKAMLEAEAREKARLLADAEVKLRKEAEEKALTEARARDEALKNAQAEAERIAQEKRKADEIRLAQEKAREEQRTRLAAEERARQEAEAKALVEAKARAQEKALAEVKAAAEARALAEANAREEAKKRAAAEGKRLEAERQLAETRRVADEKAREEARLKADAEEQRLAEQKRLAEEKVLAQAKARQEAEEKARQEALALARADLEVKRLNQEKVQAEALAQPALATTASSAPVSLDIAKDKKTKITNVDVVNRSIDRTQMTFGVEFEYKDQLTEPMLGIDVLRESEPEVRSYFVSRPAEIGRSRRNFALFPVKFQPPANLQNSGDFATDQVMVYLTDKRADRYNVFPATMLLRWRAAGSERVSSTLSSENAIEIDDFKQNDPSNGYVSVKYNLLAGKGRIRAKVYERSRPDSASYFSSNMPEVPAGRGLQLIEVRIDAETKTPSEFVRADTIEIELIDPSGRVLAKTSKQAKMLWTRPK